MKKRIEYEARDNVWYEEGTHHLILGQEMLRLRDGGKKYVGTDWETPNPQTL